jgi:hypothetical protein
MDYFDWNFWRATRIVRFRILMTILILAIWTSIAWMPYLISVIYTIITGEFVSAEVDIATAVLVFICLCSDSVILLVFDYRWNAAARDFLAKLKKSKALISL